MKTLIMTSVLLAAAACCFFFCGSRTTAEAQSRMPLFTLTESASVRSLQDRSSVASVRETAISFPSADEGAVNSAKVSFPLFDGKLHDAVRTGFESRSAGDFTWRGKLFDGGVPGDVILSFKHGTVAGLVYSGNSVYEIVPRGGEHRLVEIDQGRFPECAGGIKGPVSAAETASAASPSAPVDSGDRIDVLVLYTAAVKTFLGGDQQAAVFAQQAIDATNTAYANSRIRQRVRLVHVQETAMVETGNFGTELSNLRANAEAAALRDLHKGDLVAMLTNSTAACGIGYLAGPAGSPTFGFSVTARGCAVGNLTFAHELGHNMGSQHNPEDGSGAAYTYGYGHYVNGSFRTVMSYVDQCPSGCARRPYFSNPAVLFNAHPTGTSEARDNSRSINNMADLIAAYRYSGSSITMSNYSASDIVRRRLARTISWTSDNLSGNVRIEFSRDEGTTWETLVVSTPNDGSEVIRINGMPSKRARVRIVSLDTPAVSDSSTSNISIK